MNNRTHISRRDVLKAALLAGGAVTLAPFLKACGRMGTPAATAAATAFPTVIPIRATGDPRSGLADLDLDTFFREAYRRWMARDPENLTTLGLAEAWGIGDAHLTDLSDSYLRQTQSLESEILSLLRARDRSSFSEAQLLTADVFEWFLDDLVRGHPFMYDDYPVNPVVTSIPYNLYMLFTVYQPLNNVHDAEAYIARLQEVGTKFGQLIDGLQRREQQGVILPVLFFNSVLSDIEALAQASPSASPYFKSFTSRLTGVSDEESTTLSTRALEAIEKTVRPAYLTLATFLTGQEARAPRSVGVWQFSDGEQYYSQCLRRHTTTELSADKVHEIGLENVERIHGEMRELFAALGYPASEGIPQLIQRLTSDSGVYQGQATVAAYEQAIDQAEALLPLAFDAQPRAQVKVIGGRDGDYYVSASFDGSRPGLFFARTNSALPRFGVKTTGFHETIPGHHFQIALAQEVPDLPDLRRGMQFNAYTEGWALYAERLMSELGAYADDPQGDVGRLQMEAYRAARLVVDTGIHAKRWTFNQAVSYLAEATGFPPDYAQGEIARYSVWPGQAASYYIGFLRLLELRQQAKDRLGSRFDLRSFHDVLLANGSVPLTIVERLVHGYIDAQA